MCKTCLVCKYKFLFFIYINVNEKSSGALTLRNYSHYFTPGRNLLLSVTNSFLIDSKLWCVRWIMFSDTDTQCHLSKNPVAHLEHYLNINTMKGNCGCLNAALIKEEILTFDKKQSFVMKFISSILFFPYCSFNSSTLSISLSYQAKICRRTLF